jgi:thiamine transporter
MDQIGSIGWITLIASLLVGVALLLSRLRDFKTRDWAELGMMLALAFALKFFSFQFFGWLRIWPNGGAITLASMVPIFYLALRRGWVVGVFAGILFGLFDFLLNPFFFHPVQFLLDYPLAFGALGLAGLWRKKYIVGIVVGGLARLTCHLLSGVIFFASYAPAGWNPWLYSLAYNASYMVPEILISVGVMALIWPRLRWVSEAAH